ARRQEAIRRQSAGGVAGRTARRVREPLRADVPRNGREAARNGRRWERQQRRGQDRGRRAGESDWVLSARIGPPEEPVARGSTARMGARKAAQRREARSARRQ